MRLNSDFGKLDMQSIGPLVRVKSVKALDAFRVHLVFADGTEKDIDLAPFFQGEIFAELKADQARFRAVQVIGNTIGWENGADIDPDVLYYDLKPAWMEATVSA